MDFRIKECLDIVKNRLGTHDLSIDEYKENVLENTLSTLFNHSILDMTLCVMKSRPDPSTMSVINWCLNKIHRIEDLDYIAQENGLINVDPQYAEKIDSSMLTIDPEIVNLMNKRREELQEEDR